MNDRIKTICLVLITLAVLVAVGTYVWSVVKNIEFKKREIKLKASDPVPLSLFGQEFDLIDLRCRIK